MHPRHSAAPKRTGSPVRDNRRSGPPRSLCATNNAAYAHIILKAKFNGKGCSALLDSGDQGNFISPDIINRDQITWKQKEDPYQLSTVEGQAVTYGQGVIDMETDHLPVLIQGRVTTTSFDITDTAQHELILGLPWLRAENPRIDWTTGQISWDQAVPQRSVAIKGAGGNSVTEHDPREGHSNESRNTSTEGRFRELGQMGKNLGKRKRSGLPYTVNPTVLPPYPGPRLKAFDDRYIPIT